MDKKFFIDINKKTDPNNSTSYEFEKNCFIVKSEFSHKSDKTLSSILLRLMEIAK